MLGQIWLQTFIEKRFHGWQLPSVESFCLEKLEIVAETYFLYNAVELEGVALDEVALQSKEPSRG